jgi:hypothetical protein
MEKIGYIYLNELIGRNLVNRVKMDEDSSFGSMFVTIQNKVPRLSTPHMVVL